MLLSIRRPDGLDTSRRLLLAASIGLCVLLALVMAIAAMRAGARSSEACTTMRMLGISNLAVVPSSRLWRHPEILTRKVDLRFAPWLPPFDPDPAGLLLRDPQSRHMGKTSR